MVSEPRLLEGLRVIDAASFIAGPVATTMLADFGADGGKIEPPGGGTYRIRSASCPASGYNVPWIVDDRSNAEAEVERLLRAGVIVQATV